MTKMNIEIDAKSGSISLLEEASPKDELVKGEDKLVQLDIDEAQFDSEDQK